MSKPHWSVQLAEYRLRLLELDAPKSIVPEGYYESYQKRIDAIEERGRQWIKGEHGYFAGSISTGGGGKSGKSVDNTQKHDIIRLRDIFIGKSVGAKSKNYDIMDLNTGEHFKLVEGTRLQNVEVFAGKGVKTEFRKADKYAKKYGGKAKDWQHVKGIGTVDYYGESRKAELHWVQCADIGKHDFFIKRWLE